MSKSETDITDENIDFGSLLATARRAQNFTVEDITQHLKIAVNIIKAIESNDIASLPPVTFTQGYIRTYAKFLELSEVKVLAAYNRAVPHETSARLKYRTSLPQEANSQSPLFMVITLLLGLAVIAALIYGGFNYYQEKVDDMGSNREPDKQSLTGNSLDSPGMQTLEIKQDAGLTSDDESAVESSGSFDYSGKENATNETSAADIGVEKELEQPPADELTPPVVNDVIEITAENGSWMQVNDDTNTRLFYDLIPAGGSKKLEGIAPFRISLGNASTTKVTVNGLDVDMSANIRANNTAVLTVSTKDQKVVLH